MRHQSFLIVCLALFLLAGCVVVDDLRGLWPHGGADRRLLGEWRIVQRQGSPVQVSEEEESSRLRIVLGNSRNDIQTVFVCRTFCVSNTCFAVLRAPVLEEMAMQGGHQDFLPGGLFRYSVSNQKSIVFSGLSSNGWQRAIHCGLRTAPLSEERAISVPTSGSLKMMDVQVSDLAVLASFDDSCWSTSMDWER